MRVGIDIGGVIIGTDTDSKVRNHKDTMFGPDFLDAPAQPDMFERVKDIVELVGAENVFIISKCRRKMQAKSLAWLWYHDFYNKTGFAYTNVYFVEQRPEKAPAARILFLDAFIDDRQDVLEHMEGIVPHLILYHNWEQAWKAVQLANKRVGATVG